MQKALKAEGHAQKMLLANINFQNMNKPYRISPHEVLELSLKNTVYQGGGGGLKTRGRGLDNFLPQQRATYQRGTEFNTLSATHLSEV